MVETAPVTIKHCKTFKKYTEEYVPQVVDYVRSWARTEPGIDFYEDKSIVKVTGTELQIKSLLGILKDRFAYIPPEEREEKKAGEADTAEE